MSISDAGVRSESAGVIGAPRPAWSPDNTAGTDSGGATGRKPPPPPPPPPPQQQSHTQTKQPTQNGNAAHVASAPPVYSVYADPSAQPFSAIPLGGPIPALPAELAGAPAAPLRVVGQPRGYSTAASFSARANTLRTRLQSAGEVVALQNSIDVARRHGRHGAAGASGANGGDGKDGKDAPAGYPGEAGTPGQRGGDG